MMARRTAHPLPNRGWDEMDAFTRWRRWLHWKPGQRKKIKNRYSRRVRRYANQEIQEYKRGRH